MKVSPSIIVTLAILWSCAAARSHARDVTAVDHAEDCDDFNSSDSNPHHVRDVTGDVKAFLCPDAVDISPCVCTVLTEGLDMHCSDVISNEQLEEIFLKDFPVKEFYSFYMYDNTAVTALHDDVFNSVTFESITLLDTNLVSLSPYALQNSVNTLNYAYIDRGNLTKDIFPLNMESYTKLETVVLMRQYLTWLPHFYSHSLKSLNFYGNMITSLEPGTFDNLPNIEYINLGYNSLTAVHPGTFVLPNSGVTIYLHENSITAVNPGVFVLPEQTDALTIYLDLGSNLLTTVDQETFGELFDFIAVIYLDGNPLDCGCDIAWIVIDPEKMSKIYPGATCADGTLLTDLDPAYYQQYC